MLSKVLFPTHLLQDDDVLIKYFKNLKIAGMKEIILIHVVALMHEKMSKEFQENDRKELEVKKKILEKEGFKVSIRVPIGIPFSEIIKTSEEENVSLIILGIHDIGMIEEPLMGNVAERILRNTRKPVLLFRISKKAKKAKFDNNIFKKIIFPTDWSKCADAVIPYLKDLKYNKNQEIIISHVMDERVIRYSSKEQIKKFKELDMSRLEELKKELQNFGFKVSIILKKGIPYHEINEMVKKEKASMVIMGSHGKGYIKEMQQGSTSEKIVRFGTTPVLLINHID